jgi:hypothetical protein
MMDVINADTTGKSPAERPGSNSSKVIDAGLTSSNVHDQFPLIAVEVGFTQPLEDLFDCAERLFRGSYKQIQLVIIVKIVETNRHCIPLGHRAP